MLRDGLFDRFPCDELYGLHNSPYNRHSEVTIRPGRAQAGASFFDITIHGRGSHGAMPQASRDPVVIGAELVSALQTIVARNIDPTHAAVVSVTRFQAGSAYNVIPAEAQLAGTFRYFEEQDARLIAERITEICAGLATAHGVQIDTDIRQVFDVLINDPERVENLISSASDIVGLSLIHI